MLLGLLYPDACMAVPLVLSCCCAPAGGETVIGAEAAEAPVETADAEGLTAGLLHLGSISQTPARTEGAGGRAARLLCGAARASSWVADRCRPDVVQAQGG